MAGQYLDLRLAARTDATEQDARQVALLKSGRYTVTRPLELGLALAPQPPDARAGRAALAAYGDAVGIAFQLRDDVLGLFGDPEQTGKGRNDDLREGKRTLLMLRALALTTGADRRFLEAALGNPALTDAEADRGRAIVAGCGALASVETRLRAEHATALAALARVPEPARARSPPWPWSPSNGSAEAVPALPLRNRAAKKVIVIGAGLGGLAAACHLAGRGHDVTVLEAGPLPGGRGRSRRWAATDSTPARRCSRCRDPRRTVLRRGRRRDGAIT